MYTYIQNERNRKTDINCDYKLTEVQQTSYIDTSTVTVHTN